MGEKADLILYNANVLTLDPRKPRASLVAVKDGKIVYVGKDDDLENLAGPGTRKFDCRRKTLVPGFNDAHCHILAFASSLLSVDCSPSSVSSIADIQNRIREQAQKVPPGSWVRAAGYDEFYLAENRHPNRRDLDQAAPLHPVKLKHRTGHASVLNSLALSLAGISIDSPEPPGGIIERDLNSGEPNGLLLEMEAYLDNMVPPLSEAEFRQGIRLANEKYISQGITSLQDATVSNGIREWDSFRRLKESGRLTPRLSIMVGIGALDRLKETGFHPGFGDDTLHLGAIKIVLDETTGSLYPSREELAEQVLRAHRAGFQVALHAIEEGPVAAAAGALELALRQAPRGGHRHRIEHCSVCPPPLLARLKAIQAVVVTQPAFIYYNGERYLATVSPEQLPWLYRIGSFLQAGLRPAASSDSPVVPNNPLIGIYAAATRKARHDDSGPQPSLRDRSDVSRKAKQSLEIASSAAPPRNDDSAGDSPRSGLELGITEKISPLEALDMYTQAAAYASFEEKTKGSIAAGKLADLVLLSADPTTVPPEDIAGIRVEMTIVDGKVVWPAE